jgi:hypothetical protein
MFNPIFDCNTFCRRQSIKLIAAGMGSLALGHDAFAAELDGSDSGVEPVPGTDLTYFLIPFDANGAERPWGGNLVSHRAIKQLMDVPVTDVFIFIHGWNGDVPAARKQYNRWLSAFSDCQADLEAMRNTRRGAAKERRSPVAPFAIRHACRSHRPTHRLARIVFPSPARCRWQTPGRPRTPWCRQRPRLGARRAKVRPRCADRIWKPTTRHGSAIAAVPPRFPRSAITRSSKSTGERTELPCMWHGLVDPIQAD